MKKYSQYFTNDAIAQLMILSSKLQSVSSVVDLGFGDGSLSKAVSRHYPLAYFYMVDIDDSMCDSIELFSNKMDIVNADVTSDSFANGAKTLAGQFDFSICNPPYEQIICSDAHRQLLLQNRFVKTANMKRLSMAVIFLVYNLMFLKESGKLSILLPDGILTRKDYQPVREDIIENYHIEKIIQVSDNSFEQTEARTHIVILSKESIGNKSVSVGQSDSDGKIIEEILVAPKGLVNRMDYAYHKWGKGIFYGYPINNPSAIEIKRGHHSFKELRENGNHPFFHSVDFKDQVSLSFNDNKYDSYQNPVIAREGDILMCRVGKRCVGKIAYVAQGSIIVSDCIYRIRVSAENRMRLIHFFSSSEGKEWIRIMSHGVCSRVISKIDLQALLNSICCTHRPLPKIDYSISSIN